MNNPFQAVLDHSTRKVVLTAAAQTPESDIETAAEELTEEEIQMLGAWACREVLHTGVSSTLTLGGACYLVHAATNRGEHEPLFKEFLEEIAVDGRRAYDAMTVFRVHGKPLLEEPELMLRFPVRALRDLAAAKVPQAVRDEALQRARRGERMTLKKVTALLQEHGVIPEPEADPAVPPAADDNVGDEDPPAGAATPTDPPDDNPNEPVQATRTNSKRTSQGDRQLWACTGDDNVMVVVRTGRESPIPNSSILAALEEATAQFRDYCEKEAIEEDRTFGQGAMTHV